MCRLSFPIAERLQACWSTLAELSPIYPRYELTFCGKIVIVLLLKPFDERVSRQRATITFLLSRLSRFYRFRMTILSSHITLFHLCECLHNDIEILAKMHIIIRIKWHFQRFCTNHRNPFRSLQNNLYTALDHRKCISVVIQCY